MMISHPKGTYTINYNAKERMVYVTPIGLWTNEDFEEYHNQFMEIIGPIICKEPWVIIYDIRKYQFYEPGNLSEEHLDWQAENNLKYRAIITDSDQAKKCLGGISSSKVPQQIFINEDEAIAWLKSKGF
ncbi:SpoIIAA family protein [Anaerocolumna xylanovorans]|uniref:SpoIIAA-like n=1 Tax=Anaerocolumna xylanovorans DSM 12503 TaxID=1121345 RepID=A0A1M7Y9J2_9FIRM|nr:STAS/SEC14 domain-containing protein [Anaerocolumna xylanovorans]SHO49303.1 hypothetical protein SAMN02745217_02242 [Anaerocolumna xylanovorans DSM 12503]